MIAEDEEEPFVGGLKFYIDVQTLKTLEEETWVDSEIIDAYMCTIVDIFKRTAYFPARFADFIFTYKMLS